MASSSSDDESYTQTNLSSPPISPNPPGSRTQSLPPSTPTSNTSAVQSPASRVASKPKKLWTPEEDVILCNAVKQFNGRNWKKVAEALPGRTHSQAAHRWQKVLDPNLKKGPWSREEDEQLQKAVETIGEGHWSRVADLGAFFFWFFP